MRFNIEYWTLLINLLLVNTAMLFFGQVSCKRHHQVSAAGLPLFLLIINFCFLLLFIIQPPPRFIQVDKEAGIVTYALLFRRQQVVLDYNRVWSEFTTRGSRTGPKKVWSLSLDNKELFFLPIGYTGWSEKQLIELNDLIVNSNS